MELSPNSLTILEKRYLMRDEKGRPIETAEDMFRRVAKNVASADKLYGKTDEELARTEEFFYQIMAKLEFLPNSPCLRGAGRELQQL
ncbi:MAG: ribonucleotide-diphosphate reductase subunit alpha, partial [Candidatus Tectomicrobia bacterium]|nr:ribonucleotide-diphosphate reductase subunit alpha [Candidatus Tectomicrobia bacterium]